MLVCVRCKEENVAGFQPLFEKVFHECGPRTRIREQSPHLLIENVGNLVCPSSYDLGEAAKIVLLSVTEGEDKPLKYPSIFFKADLCVINKIDLLPHVPFELSVALENAHKVHPGMDIIKVSCLTRSGLGEWLDWLEKRNPTIRSAEDSRALSN